MRNPNLVPYETIIKATSTTANFGYDTYFLHQNLYEMSGNHSRILWFHID